MKVGRTRLWSLGNVKHYTTGIKGIFLTLKTFFSLVNGAQGRSIFYFI